MCPGLNSFNKYGKQLECNRVPSYNNSFEILIDIKGRADKWGA